MKLICKILEYLRWISVIVGIQLAEFLADDPISRLHILMPWIVISLSGLTGIESVFFGKAASELTGYKPNAYQRQTGLNNLSVAIVAILVLVFKWGTYAEITVMSCTLVFLTLSALNHLWTGLKEGNHKLKNFMRPVLTTLLLIFTLPYIVNALKALVRINLRMWLKGPRLRSKHSHSPPAPLTSWGY